MKVDTMVTATAMEDMANKSRQLPQILSDAPIDQLYNWLGFSAKRDKTMLPPTFLVDPSKNCLIPDGDKILPRGGTQIQFQGAVPVLEDGIIGKYTKYKNFFGIEMDVKAYRDATEGEQVYVLFNGVYVPICLNPNTLLNGTSKIYFSTYNDENLDISQSKRVNRLCWVNGYKHSDGTGRVFSWTGGISLIFSVTGTTISVPTGLTWRQLGFTVNKAGTGIDVTVQGVQYSSSTIAELDTDTLTIGAHSLTAGMLVTSSVEVDDLVAPMDLLRQNKNYMYYGNFMYAKWWMSNQYARPSVTSVINYDSNLNDLFIPSITDYTGTGAPVYRVEIDNTPINIQTSNNFIPIFLDTSGYSGGGLHKYTIIITEPAGALSAYGYEVYKDGIQTLFFGPLQDPNGAVIPGPFTMPDGLTFNLSSNLIGALLPFGAGPYAQYTGALQVGMTWTLEINDVTTDTFKWSINGGAPVATGVVITGAPQLLNNGVYIQFSNTTGHEIGDFWVIQVNQAVTRPWADFYYTIDFNSQNPLRRPGEGYIYNLPSNFWTMDTFEDSMYVNTSNGEWGYTTPTLSANLLSEDFSFTPLKQVEATKVLYPYLTSHNRNDLIFIDENKNLNSLGRLQLIQKVQMNAMTNIVLNKFQSLSFEDGSLIFQDNATWITSPRDNTMMVYNERTKYWQAPQFIPNLGLLTIIGTKLYTHSYLNTATRSLNDYTADGDDGVEYEVVIRNSTYDHGDRWNKKTTNMGFWEGYVDEAPKMKMRVYFDVDGCQEVKETDILPVYCSDVVNNGNFGGAQDGEHEHGGDVTQRTNYARFLWDKLGVHHFYFSSVEFSCRAKKHPYEILSMGINLAQSKFNNKEYRPEESTEDQLLPL